MNKERKHLKTVIGKSNREKYDTWYIMEKMYMTKIFTITFRVIQYQSRYMLRSRENTNNNLKNFADPNNKAIEVVI
jgi:hypothetical protein